MIPELFSAEISLFYRLHLIVSGSQHHTQAHRQVRREMCFSYTASKRLPSFASPVVQRLSQIWGGGLAPEVPFRTAAWQRNRWIWVGVSHR